MSRSWPAVELARANEGWEGLVWPNRCHTTNVAQIEACTKCHARRGFVHRDIANDSFLSFYLKWFSPGRRIWV